MKVNSSPIKSRILIAALSAVIIFLPICTSVTSPVEAQTQDRGLIYVEAKGANPTSRYYALVIGNNDYRHLEKLMTAVNDAQEVEKVLRNTYGFETRILLDAERDRILMALNEYRRKLDENSKLLIYFAGHGEYDQDVDKAYWLPVDARPNDNVHWISADDVTTNIKGISARHVLIISDSCYSGMIPRYARVNLNPVERERYLQKMIDGKSRILMSSGGNEPVADQGSEGHSVFARALLRGLTEIEEDVFTGEELFYEFIRESVAGKSEQTPQYNPIRNSGHDSGDFVFVRKTSNKKARTQTSNTAAVELAFWETIKNSDDPEDYRAYLQQYPDGSFASLARIRAGLDAPSAPVGDSTIPNPGAQPETSEESNSHDTPASPSGGYEFDVIRVNESGEAIERSKGRAGYFVEDVSGVALEMVEIPAGTFSMGSPQTELRRLPSQAGEHQVALPSFYMSRFEVTQAQWRAVARLPKVRRDLERDPSRFKGDDLPVERVSWEDAVEFCARLAKATGRKYRLPSEAEWEYACRAGTTTSFHFGDRITPELVNYDGRHPYGASPKAERRVQTSPVGSLRYANAFGLYDMHGNVSEWCLDLWHEDYRGAPADGSAWASKGDKKYRVLRGGAWDVTADFCRSAGRAKNSPDHRNSNIGFRVVFSDEPDIRTRSRMPEIDPARESYPPQLAPPPASQQKPPVPQNKAPQNKIKPLGNPAGRRPFQARSR